MNAAFISNSAPLVYYLQTQTFFHLKTPPVTFLRVQRVPGEGSYMRDTYPPYLDQGLIQAVSTVSGPRYSRYSMYCISLYLDRGLIQLIQYVSDCIHTVSYM